MSKFWKCVVRDAAILGAAGVVVIYVAPTAIPGTAEYVSNLCLSAGMIVAVQLVCGFFLGRDSPADPVVHFRCVAAVVSALYGVGVFFNPDRLGWWLYCTIIWCLYPWALLLGARIALATTAKRPVVDQADPEVVRMDMDRLAGVLGPRDGPVARGAEDTGDQPGSTA